MTNKMDMELRNGQMDPNSKGTMKMVKNLVKDCLFGLIKVVLKEFLSIIILMDLALILGMMVGNIKEIVIYYFNLSLYLNILIHLLTNF